MSLIPPPFFMNTVVAIGHKDDNAKEISWYASGFFYARVSNQGNSERKLNAYLVSNCHVLSGRKEIFLRLNPQGKEDAIEVPLKLDAMSLHPKVDVGVVPIDFELLLKHKLNASCFENDRHAINVAGMAKMGVGEGDFVYVLGFPMSLVGPGDRRNAVLVRNGTIARLRDTLDLNSPSFLVDAFVFPGNSGGPVILKPEVFAIEGTQKVDTAVLIGIVASNVFFQDTAISAQTKRPRIIFEDNAGLGVVYPVDCIDECIGHWESKQTTRMAKLDLKKA